MTWEEAILWLRAQDDQRELVRQCYYDDPLEDAAERFRASEEWAATRRLLWSFLPGRVLDLGAGRGIASHAFARAGSTVTAVEPEASDVVGRGAIARLASRQKLPIDVVDALGEALPFDDAAFDVVYGRAVLHHAQELDRFCAEAARVLRPGGAALFVREHVISKKADLAAFRSAHALQALSGSENAYLMAEYVTALTKAGLRVRRILGPLEDAVAHSIAKGLIGPARWRNRLARLLMASPWCRRWATRRLSRQDDTPGRHFAFLGVKP
jgi:SAM-dependent methyltransferase